MEVSMGLAVAAEVCPKWTLPGLVLQYSCTGIGIGIGIGIGSHQILKIEFSFNH